MNTLARTSIATSALLLAAIVGGSISAQEQPPGSQIEPGSQLERSDSAVEAILAMNPSTPLEWSRAAMILADLGHPDLARGFLNRVLEGLRGLDQESQLAVLVSLEDHFGADKFTRMASRKDLAPEAATLNNAILTAVSRQTQDPKLIGGAISRLQDPSADVRDQALAEIRRARGAAVGPMVAVLVDPNRAGEHAGVRAGLAALGSDAVGALIAMLQAPDPRLAVEAINLLARIEASESVLYLLAPCTSTESDPKVSEAAAAALAKLVGLAPNKSEASDLLVRRAKQYFEQLVPMREDYSGRVEVWTWDDAAKMAVGSSQPAHDASLLVAARLAREAFSVAGEDEQVRLLYLATMLEQAAHAKGLENPLSLAEGTLAHRAAEFGVEAIDDLLVYALDTEHTAAATVAARILGRHGTAGSLLYRGSQPAPLVRATRHPDRRLRFAAVEAIVQLEPVTQFPGSSWVVESLDYFASSRAFPRVLIAGPNTSETQRVGGYLAALGYEFDTARTGQEAIRKLIASPDYQIALVDAALERPTVDFLLQQLRHDCRTASLPVGVVARAGQLARARHLTRNDSLAEAMPRPHAKETVLWQVERLRALIGRRMVLPEERFRQADRALEMLAELSDPGQRLYDLRRVEETATTALYVPQLAQSAVTLLGNLGTAASQQALLDVASRWTQPLDLRSAAARAFQQSTKQNGILLTSSEILRQYERYNQSETMDADTQQVLGTILDSIEARSKAQKEASIDALEGNAKTVAENVQ